MAGTPGARIRFGRAPVAQRMDGYDETTYGDSFADVYDDWYSDVSDTDATVVALAVLAGGGDVLELGVGTGRLAVPLAEALARDGGTVTGIDTSTAMLDRLRERDGDERVRALRRSMEGPLPDGPFDLVFVAYNTLFSLGTAALQARCFHAAAGVLRAGGRFVVEAFVPDIERPPGSDVTVRSLSADRVVLSVSVQHPDRQVAEGQFVELTGGGGVRLRPWSIRYSTPDELDTMAAEAGFELEVRWASFTGDLFGPDSDRHVTVYRRP